MNRYTATILIWLFPTLLCCATAQTRTADVQIMDYLTKEFEVNFTPGNRVELLPTATAKYAALEKDLREAREHIHMEYFALRYDSISQVIFGILRDKAKEGVEVRVIVDAFSRGTGRDGLNNRRLKELRKAGIEIELFDRFRFPWFNHSLHRDHRKIVVIDGRIGYIGGMNIADYYIHGKKGTGEWRDMHMRVCGPVVQDLQQVFVNFWNHTAHDNIQGERYYRQGSRLPDLTDAADSLSVKATATTGVINRTPSKDNPGHIRQNRIGRDALRQAIDAAQSQIQIVNPYFAPSLMVRQALKRALKRGVRVEIMISAQSDVRLTPRAVEYTCHGLMRHGAHTFIYEGGFHHSKVMTIDHRVTYTGSLNLDHRSLYSDYECNLMICDPETTQRFETIFETDKQRCFELTPETWNTRFSRGKRLRCWFAHFFRPMI